MTRYRMLAVDIDGTLVNSQNELTDATRAAMLRAQQAGIAIVLATGRRYSRVLPLVEPLGLNLPLVTSSGALIKRAADHRTLFQAQFAEGVLHRCLAIIAREGYQAVICGDTYDQGFDYYCAARESRQPELAEFLEKNLGRERIHADVMSDPPLGIFTCFAMGSRGAMRALHMRLEERLPNQLYVHVIRSPLYTGYMCEIAPVGVSKWTGIRRLADEWGIRTEEICAAGDDVNDIPMIEAAGLGVAMGNALDEVKAVADRIAPSHDNNGLVQVVDWLLE